MLVGQFRLKSTKSSVNEKTDTWESIVDQFVTDDNSWKVINIIYVYHLGSWYQECKKVCVT